MKKIYTLEKRGKIMYDKEKRSASDNVIKLVVSALMKMN